MSPAVIILTLNEEANLPQALGSLRGWAERILVVDSYSTDRTVEIARAWGAEVYQHRFEGYPQQRNYALSLVDPGDWVLFLDADEWLPESFKQVVSARLESHPSEAGFYVNRRFIWMGKWLRRGLYPVWLLRLVRAGRSRWEPRSVNEHLLVDGPTARLEAALVHEDRKPLAAWVAKHDGYARKEADELLAVRQDALPPNLFGSQASRKRWIRECVWRRLPPFLRAALYFTYRYFVCGGFLEGRPGAVYHVLQALWFPLLIDAYYLEKKVTRDL